MSQPKSGGLVYSTEFGRMCPNCNQPIAKCSCSKTKPIPKGDGIVRLMRETKGRKGKGVTLVTGLSLSENDLKKLAQDLKKKCGTGGTVKDFVIEIQGVERDLLKRELEKLNYTVKIAGG